MDAVIKHPSMQVRYFIETVLGFGKPLGGQEVNSLFKKKPGSLFYAANNSQHQASVNVIDKAEWSKIHNNETGVVLFDVTRNVLERIESFLGKELRKRKVRLKQAVSVSESNALLTKFDSAVEAFTKQYKEEVDKNAEIQTTIALRPIPGRVDYQLLVRLFLKSEHEHAYVCINIDTIVKEIELNITSDQIDFMTQNIAHNISSYGEVSDLFDAIGPFDIASFIASCSVSQDPITPDTMRVLWKNYRDTILANKELFESDDPAYREWLLYQKVEQTVEIEPESIANEILFQALKLGQLLVSGYLVVNSKL